ncbi:hypothetical protein ACFX13_024739 [Malus domestica]
MANISSAIASFPFRPLSCPCSLTIESLFFILNFATAATSFSFEITLLAYSVVTNRSSSLSSCFFSSKKGDRSNPSDNKIM